MTDEQQLEQQLLELGESMTPGADFATSVMKRIEDSNIAPVKTPSDSATATSVWRRIRTLLSIVAVAALMIWLRSTSDPPGVVSSDWWLGSPAVYAGEIVDALEQAQVQGVVFRDRTTYLLEDGSTEEARNIRTVAVVDDRYRYESTTEGRLNMVTWAVPDNDEFVVTKYLALSDSTRVRRLPREEGLGASPLSRVLELSRLIEQSSRHMEPRDIEGHECVGFEIDAAQVHRKHKSGSYQIWIDTDTKRPVKMVFDRESTIRDDRNIKRVISTTDRFEWNPDLPDDTFVPHDDPQPLR